MYEPKTKIECPECKGKKFIYKEKLVWNDKLKKEVDAGRLITCPKCKGEGFILV